MSYQRNMVIIVAHGLRSDALGDSQVWPLATPGLERLGRRGLRVVAGSACPSDSGAMVSLLTGTHARQHGYLDQTRGVVPCDGWPALFKEAGYHMAGVGLVGPIEAWLQDVLLVEAIDQIEAPRCRYLASMRDKGLLPVVEGQRRQRRRSGLFEPDRLLLEPEEDIDGYIFHQARLLLDQLPDQKPWVLVVVLSGPGNDLPPPTLYDGVVDRQELAKGFIPSDLCAIDALAELDYPRVMLQRMDARTLANIRSDYLGRVALIDHGISKLITGVQERADMGRTWFVIASDRGQLLGEQGLVGHRSFLYGAVEVPFLISPPVERVANFEVVLPRKAQAESGMADREDLSRQFQNPPDNPEPQEPPRSSKFPKSTQPKSESDSPRENPKTDHQNPTFTLVSTVDVAATIAALGGCELPSACVGRSLLSSLTNEPSFRPIAGGCLSEFGKRLMLETERYKVIFNTDTLRAIGLYDLFNDPEEKQNLVDSPIAMNLLDALRWRVGEALMPLRATPGGGIG